MPNMNIWQPDGAATRARIGVLTPHLDPVPETEFQAMAPEDVSIHVARVPLGMVGPDGSIEPSVGKHVAEAFFAPPEIDRATVRLAAVGPDAIVCAFTSGSYVLGPAGDWDLAGRLEGASDGAPVLVQSQSLLRGLSKLGVRRITLVHPPWFDSELDRSGTRYFEGQGIEVVEHSPARLRQDYGEVHPERLFDWIVTEMQPRGDAIVIAGGGMRAIGAIKALEDRLDRPVLTANQASFWHALRSAGIDDRLTRYGSLFAH